MFVRSLFVAVVWHTTRKHSDAVNRDKTVNYKTNCRWLVCTTQASSSSTFNEQRLIWICILTWHWVCWAIYAFMHNVTHYFAAESFGIPEMTRNVRIMDCTLEMLVRCQKEEAKRMSAHRINNIKRIQTDRVSLYHVLFILIRHCVCLHIAVYQIGSQQRRRSDEHEYTYINTRNVHRASCIRLWRATVSRKTVRQRIVCSAANWTGKKNHANAEWHTHTHLPHCTVWQWKMCVESPGFFCCCCCCGRTSCGCLRKYKRQTNEFGFTVFPCHKFTYIWHKIMNAKFIYSSQAHTERERESVCFHVVNECQEWTALVLMHAPCNTIPSSWFMNAVRHTHDATKHCESWQCLRAIPSPSIRKWMWWCLHQFSMRLMIENPLPHRLIQIILIIFRFMKL